ncbi:MAG: hypothetical protein O3A84_01675 [Proteobacteria bacterium]|nr:hypothetical protein [Pseudomonadota bacterium]
MLNLPRGRFSGLLFLLLFVIAGCSQTQFFSLDKVTKYPVYGPAKADGVVIYNHGRSRTVDTAAVSRIPNYLEPLYQSNWDLLLLKRPVTGDNRNDATNYLLAAIKQVRDQGYKRIILAGQSAGGWASIDAARKEKVHAIIATSPAAHGTNDTSVKMGTVAFGDILNDIKETKVMLFFFNRDPFQTADRGKIAKRILGDRKIEHRIIDHPRGLSGHGAYRRKYFTSRYGPQIRDFVDPASN